MTGVPVHYLWFNPPSIRMSGSYMRQVFIHRKLGSSVLTYTIPYFRKLCDDRHLKSYIIIKGKKRMKSLSLKRKIYKIFNLEMVVSDETLYTS